ncbi:hypothetical protein SDC9_68938 [bioreactor metagenome]|uniref:Uncharacterized protein n=1 Tax=bioreactor metagenome TaxID=1076179 RepID=A0A644Y7C7_9ZZZZ
MSAEDLPVFQLHESIFLGGSVLGIKASQQSPQGFHRRGIILNTGYAVGFRGLVGRERAQEASSPTEFLIQIAIVPLDLGEIIDERQ